MKFRIASLLTLLASISFLQSPALGMLDEEYSSSVPSRPREVLTEEKRSLDSFLGLQNYPKAFLSLRAELPSTTSDEEIVKHLITSNKYKKSWDALGREDQIWVSAKIINEARKIELDDFISKQNYASAFNATRKIVRADLPDEEVVKYLLESNGYKKWSELSEPNKIAVTKKIATQAQQLELKDLLSKQNYPKAFKSLRTTLPATASNEQIVQFLLESNGYKKWKEIAPENRKWLIHKVKGEKIIDLDKLISTSADTYIALRNKGDDTPVDELIKSILSKNDDWKTLSDKDKEEVVEKIYDKKEEYFASIADKIDELKVDLTELNRVVDELALKLAPTFTLKEREKDWEAIPVITLEERERRKAEQEKDREATPVITLKERERRKAEREKDRDEAPVITLKERERRKAEREKDRDETPFLTIEDRERLKAEREERAKGHEDDALF
ncbi:MAG: hypothetical protein JSR85_05180 [Proteobacteria bacterium]|nr:hypothetical protein [Pseudomonadota bacterium]